MVSVLKEQAYANEIMTQNGDESDYYHCDHYGAGSPYHCSSLQ